MNKAYLEIDNNILPLPSSRADKFLVRRSSVDTTKSLVSVRKESGSLTSSTKPSDNSYTFIEEYPLYLRIFAVFWDAKKEFFEDSIENVFLTELGFLIAKYKSEAIEHIAKIVLYEQSTLEVSGEALRLIGRINDEESYEFRRWLLEQSLTLSSPRAKGGAILGLASMDDKRTISKLKTAISKEKCFELKEDMELVLKQLES